MCEIIVKTNCFVFPIVSATARVPIALPIVFA